MSVQYGLPKDTGALHFIGIGGIGMSGIAEILHNLGYSVQGSDQAEGSNVKRLREEKDIRISIGHEAENIKDTEGNLPAAVVVSSAIKNDNVELQAARNEGVPIVRRAEMLAELMRLKWAIAIGGTHGKTTTTSMVGQMLETADFDPTIINGGIVNAYGSNTRLGQSDVMVAEADESDGTFTRLPASVAVVTNIDEEHMDHYGSFEQVKDAYRQFITNVPFYGFAVLCLDHPEVQAMIPSVKDRKIITYGFNPQADVQVSNLDMDAEGSRFDVTFADHLNDGEELTLRDVFLPMLGRHNVQNSLVALAIAQEMGVKPPIMKKALENFTGVKRRFTKTGEANGVTIIDDYAHHPIEIETVLKTARTAVKANEGRVVAVMQPHRYSRLHDLFEDFCKCFNDADTVIIADVYEAGEDPIEGVNKNSLVEGIKNHGHREVIALPERKELAHCVAKYVKPNDFVICMGAGDITGWAYELPDQLETEIEKAKGHAA
ncbi:MAG: UDP-N-acetylmuramate--L-alanine ligase [Alphaproteobacteria bacterium]|nr:UDP-N-acetylmuramate--L-alanine ligase [Alphaproteobacteria bacterium]